MLAKVTGETIRLGGNIASWSIADPTNALLTVKVRDEIHT